MPEPGWAADPQTDSWQEWEQWQDWGPPPALHPDHPSAPVPRVQLPDDSRRLYAVPDGAGATGYLYQRQTHAGWQQTSEYWSAAQDYSAAVREAAERDAAAITQQATSQADTIREAAEREAATIRAAAEREAAELRARLDSMSGELGRVAAYVTENLVAPAMPTTAPPLPGATPDPPDARPALPATRPTKPATTPDSVPTGPAKPRTMPAKKPPKPGRQQQAMRIAKYSTAALVSFALVFGIAEIEIHGMKFFVFREEGQGQSTNGPTDQQFLARQAAAAHHHAPKGRHAKKPQPAATSTTKGEPAPHGQ